MQEVYERLSQEFDSMVSLFKLFSQDALIQGRAISGPRNWIHLIAEVNQHVGSTILNPCALGVC